MNTFRDNSPGSRPAWHYLFATIVIILWLAACGGGSGQDAAAPVVVVPPPQSCAVDPVFEHDCPTGAICVGYVTETSVGNIYPVAFGNWPDWSPDGLQIAFHREGTIYIVNADGSGENALVPGTEPAWSPHGGLIAFTSPQGIAVVNRDGSNYKTLASNDSDNAIYLSSPSWSPDGQRIAYARLEGTAPPNSRIYAMRADGSLHGEIYTRDLPYRFEQDPSLSPADGSLAFTDGGLRVVEIEVGEVIKLAGLALKPDWSPDGSLIAFAAVNECRRNAADIEIISSRGLKSFWLLADALQPAWSPEGARIAFASTIESPGNDAFPHVTKPAQIYLRETPGYFDSVSRFVLYYDQKFELQYVTGLAGFFTYTGSYTQTDTKLTFNFHASSPDDPWTAYGMVVENRMSVTFNTSMSLSDFESGTYVLVPQEE